MSCSLVLPFLSGPPAGSQFYYNPDDTCLGLSAYVNGTDCADWPEAGLTSTVAGTFIFEPTAGPAFTSSCGAPLYTTEFAPDPIPSTIPCDVSNSLLVSTGGVGYYIYPTNAAGDLATQSWTIGEYPGDVSALSTDATLVATNVVAAGFTTVPTVISTVIDSTTTVITTFITTYSTLVLTATVTSGATTVTQGPLLKERQGCVLEGPAGFYASDEDGATVIAVNTIWTATSTFESSFTPTAYSSVSSTYTNVINETSTFINSVVGASVATTFVKSTVTVTGEDTTTTTPSVPTGTAGPFVINIAAIVTISTALEKRAEPTAAPALAKRQDFQGFVGLADADGTVGAVEDIDDALVFYVIDGELVTSIDGEDWYTYTELSVVTDPGSETWVLQNNVPPADSISTEFSGVELEVLDWSNADFPSTTATLCLGSALASNPDVPVLNWWYDVSQAPPEGECIGLSVGITDVAPGPSSTTVVTSLTTVTSISTITGDPLTTYVCDNACPLACSTNSADIITTTICSTAPNGLSTCQPCLSSTVGPIIETEIAVVTSTVACPSPPCPQYTIVPPPAPYNPPCDDDTVTIYAGNGAPVAPAPAPDAGAPAPAPAGDAGAAPAPAGDAGAPVAEASTSSSTTTKTSTTKTGTPTASPSLGAAGKLAIESSSFAIWCLAALAFLA
ncbi:hypothetical protein TWF696_008529 [Orbilia brochopaga]|uniref:DUF7908 domain-containing protein n=1 Tax=Orbilia brochopaga TaxID=3140254 RepID=A0AAV9UHF3_9PEZI